MFLNNVNFNYFLCIFILLIVFIVITILINNTKDKLLRDEIEKYIKEKGIEIKSVKNKNYDYIMKTKDKNYYISLLKVPSNSSITINSKYTWCLRFGGKRKGRSYPNKRYLTEVEPFLRMRLSNDNDMKLIIIVPSTEVILKYINESDICEVNPKDTPHGYKVISYHRFKSNFNDIFFTKSKKSFY